MTKDQVIALAVAMGTPLATATANYDAAFPPPPADPDRVVGMVRCVLPSGGMIETVELESGDVTETVVP